MQGPQYFLLCLVHLISALTDEEKKTIVEKHNVYRSRADPLAADMKALRWDRTLEELATSYAAKCIWDHNIERGFRGENLFIMSGSSLDVELGLADWHRERDYYNFTTDTCQEGQMCGHYTQMVWANTERVGCGEKFCEKLEGFDESDMYLLVCNYEPPGNFEGQKPYTPGDPCTSCPSSHICRESLCADTELEKEKTSTVQPSITRSQLDPEPTQSELDPEPTQSELDPEPTQSELDPEPTQLELDPEPTQSELDPEPTQSELDPEPTQSELDPEPTQSELDREPTQSELDPEPTQSELDREPTQSELEPEPTQSELEPVSTQSELEPVSTQSELDPKLKQSTLVQETTQSELFPEPTTSELDPKPTQLELSPETTQSEMDLDSTKSRVVPKPAQSELDLESTQSEVVPKPIPSELMLDSISTRTSTEPLEINTPQKMENSSAQVIEQTPTQPTSQVIALPSQEYISVSVRPNIPLDATLHSDKTGIDKAFSNDEPDIPTEKEAMIPVTVSVMPTKPARTQDLSILVDKDNKPQDREVHTVISQDQARRKDSIQQPQKTSPQKKKEKQNNMNLTSFKWKNQLSSSMRWDYKSGLSERTYFGRPVQGLHFGQAPRPCSYPCLSSQLKSPRVFPLYRTNHISSFGGYDKQSQMVSKSLVKPSFQQLFKLLGYKRGVYSLYLPTDQHH